ncbi:transcriptional regulator with PAS, ATPase and Fis domain [Bacillus ectoiniformans]|uniref:sigma 54-interacting transcriptional regulator n=1 Tax=Bacillus ectoiniformans TaxID=1494429 RepID=UPI00195D20B4|nr:sigma 54-interacting transcriptional regulator [Bacillus ectoiniformans]MBM7649451.1 transcriptional regulator with PAS, ATPase and Fis domain [Bacillus ectoiniformans]
MFLITEEKVKPFISIAIEEHRDQDLIDVSHIKEPYIFLSKENTLVSYIHLKSNHLAHKGRIKFKTLLSQAVCIENVYKLHKEISLPIAFQVIGEPLAIVVNDQGEPAGYLKREELLTELFKQENQSVDLLKTLLTSIPMGMFVVDREENIVNCNDAGLKMIKSTSDKIMNKPARSIFHSNHIKSVFATGKTILNQIQITDEMGVLVDYCPIMNFDNELEGMLIVVQDLPKIEEMAMEIEDIKNLNTDLNAILSTIYDEILVVNHKAELIRFSDTLISDFWNVDLHDYIGKNILEFEKQGLFTPSVTRLVIEKKKKVSVVQETSKGRKILAVGNPVFNEKGDIDRIIIASRDITETSKLKNELKEMKKISEQYKKELDSFKNQDRTLKKLMYRSPKMEKIVQQIKKIAQFSSTVLITGESGSGKEVIAQAIHQMGRRSEKPFLKLNCGAIPENLLESELFGYSKGAFTGADKEGKDGYFKMADHGVLFLDEIGEMPSHLQVKLLRVLQEQEVVPVGSTQAIPVDVQIIAATNKKLEKMVEEGTFREDLFYRLNVIPLRIPPLRERIEDISVLAFHFLQQLNDKYDKSFHLTPDAVNVLEFYSWPGNVRELQNIIERLVVSADDSAIDAEFVSRFLSLGYDFKKSKPMITRVIPLQEALEDVENQLILLAMKQYKTTTKAAKALGVSQSSVSRKYQKIMNEKNGEPESPVY